MAKEPEPFSLFGDGEDIDLEAFLATDGIDPLPEDEIEPPDLPQDDPQESPREEALDELDLSAYNRHWAGAFGDSADYTEHFLAEVAEAYNERGYGRYDCLLVFRHSRVTDADVFRFRRSVASRISRLRAVAPKRVADFRVVTEDYMILPDRQHVLFRLARMSENYYRAWVTAQRSEKAKERSINERLAQLL